MRPINLIVIHCTASRIDRTLSPNSLDAMHRRNGWTCCGYHYYITRDGTVHHMRPLDLPGAHARGFNARSIGIAYEGGLRPDGCAADTRTAAQRAALLLLIEELLRKYPRCRVCGHRDLSPDLNGNGILEPSEWVKLCPCFDAEREYASITNR